MNLVPDAQPAYFLVYFGTFLTVWQEMFTRYRKRTIVGITVQMFAQINGINIISFYLPSTLSSAGYDNRKSLLYTAANALPYTAATIVTWWLADRWGRKPLLILGGQSQNFWKRKYFGRSKN